MTLDQYIQIWNMIGTWVAGIATTAAVIVSLHLARRGEQIRIRIKVGIDLIYLGDGTPSEEHLAFTIVNLSVQPVTVNSIGWRVGKGKDIRFALQPVFGAYTSQYPKQIAYGEQVRFAVSFTEYPSWIKEFSIGFVHDLSKSNLRTLRALIHTSVGETIEATPEDSLLQRLNDVKT